MTLDAAIALLLGLAVLLAATRLLVAARRSPPAQRPRAWRLCALVLLQAGSATLLYLTLLPPQRPVDAGTLLVLTAGADISGDSVAASAERAVALPEATATNAAERVPDLATALRRHPGSTRLHVVGAGLPARDRDAIRGLALSFAPAALPRGVVELWATPHATVGGGIVVRGRVHGVDGGSAELLDPAGARSDRAALGKDGGFALTALARAPGLATFRLRVRDVGGAVVEDADVPLEIAAGAKPRVLLLAGAPNAELKYLRRWIADAGMPLHSRISIGGGLQIGDPARPFNAATLAGHHLLVIDERAWQSLGAGAHATLREAVRGGLGVLVRVTGPLSAEGRGRLRALGFEVATAAGSEGVRLAADAGSKTPPPAANAPDDAGGDANAAATDALPPLTREPLRIDATDASPLLTAADGMVLATWRAEGRGRVGAWLLDDSHRLVLTGHGDRHARLWSEAFAVLARAAGEAGPTLAGDLRAGERAVLCGITAGDRLVAPSGHAMQLLPDPATGAAACAGAWPTEAGWHSLHSGDRSWPVHVRAHEALPGIDALELRAATARLVSDRSTAAVETASVPGPRWPWFLAWLAVSGLLWSLERARHGRRARPPDAATPV